jgi:hypothetical protein
MLDILHFMLKNPSHYTGAMVKKAYERFLSELDTRLNTIASALVPIRRAASVAKTICKDGTWRPFDNL